MEIDFNSLSDLKNKNLIKKIRRDLMKDNNRLHLKVDVKIEDPSVDDVFSHVLHYNFTILGSENCCPNLETMNVSFSYHEINKPDTNYYDTKGGYYFFKDPYLLYGLSDGNKKMLLKKYALLSFFYEYRYNLSLDEKSSDLILKKLKDLKTHILFVFLKKEKFKDACDDKKLNELLGKTKNSIQYSSDFTILNLLTSKKIKPKSEAEIK